MKLVKQTATARIHASCWPWRRILASWPRSRSHL